MLNRVHHLQHRSGLHQSRGLVMGWLIFWVAVFAISRSGGFTRLVAVMAILYLLCCSCVPAVGQPELKPRPKLMAVGGWVVPITMAHYEYPAEVKVYTINGELVWEGSAAASLSARLPAERRLIFGITSTRGKWQIKEVYKKPNTSNETP